MATDWPGEQHLRARLAALISSPPRPAAPFVVEWTGTTYRFASRDYSDRDRFTDGEGARRNGGRFTPIGGPRTLYLSLDRATATAELDSWYEHYSLPDTAFQPRVLAAVAVCAGLLLDLASPETLTNLGITAAHVGEEWRMMSDEGQTAPIQGFGRLIYEAGFEGVRFPSARREGGLNFALFPDNFRDGSHALMLNSD
jgi:RES domain-containing protein